MKGLILCILSLVALPSVLGIQCYSCEPSDYNFCDDVSKLNVTNCTSPNDACAVVRFTVTVGQASVSSNMMMCAIQAVCGVYKEQACKIAKEESPYNMTACDMKCCQTEKCNTQALVAPRSTAPYTNPTFMFHLLASLAVLAY